jgi:hypothetical protein
MKNSILPLVCLFIGGVAGYGVRTAQDAGQGIERAQAAAKPSATGRETAAAHSASTPAPANATPAAPVAMMSLGDQMKELLVDMDYKSTKKALAKLSASELQASLAIVATMPKSSERDSLRGYLYRAWAALDPNAAWKAALADPLDLERGALSSAVAGELAKKNPLAAIELARSLGPGARRQAVANMVYMEWGMMDVEAAMTFMSKTSGLVSDNYIITSPLTKLASTDPTKAANLTFLLKDSSMRRSLLGNVLEAWAGRDVAAAMKWAEGLENPGYRRDAVSAAMKGWAKSDPAAAINRARQLADKAVGNEAIENIWNDWFRKNPGEATDFIASQSDEALMHDISYHFARYSESFTAKERADLLAKLPEGRGKQEILSRVTDSHISKGLYTEAMELLNAMPDSHSRDRTVFDLGQEMAAANLDAAASWIKLQPDSSDRDLAIAGYARTLSRTDPNAALEWVKTIPDAKVRDGAIKNVAINWLRSDPAKAEAWMSQAGFKESDKKSVRSSARYNSDSFGASISVGTRR